MKRSKTPLYLVLVVALAALLSGCNSDKKAYAADRSSKFLGIMDSNPGTYEPAGATDFPLSTDELTNRQNVSGDNVSLFWGLVKFKDY